MQSLSASIVPLACTTLRSAKVTISERSAVIPVTIRLLCERVPPMSRPMLIMLKSGSSPLTSHSSGLSANCGKSSPSALHHSPSMYLLYRTVPRYSSFKFSTNSCGKNGLSSIVYFCRKMSAPDSRNFKNQWFLLSGLHVPSKQLYGLSRRDFSMSNTFLFQVTTSSP